MKKRSLCVILIFSTQLCLAWGEIVFNDIFKMAAAEGIKCTDRFGEKLRAIAKMLGSDTKETAKILAVASEKLGIESVTKIAETVDKCIPLANKCIVITGAGTAIGGVWVGWNIMGDVKNNIIQVKSWLFPSQQAVNAALKAKLENDLLVAKMALLASLKKNAQGKLSASGVPEACLQEARALAMAGGQEELKKIIETFKQLYGNPTC